jgi:hypothetical protein
MSARELILDGGDTLDGAARKLRLNDTPDGTCVTVSTPAGIVAVLDRRQQHMLLLYLEERLRGYWNGVLPPDDARS